MRKRVMRRRIRGQRRFLPNQGTPEDFETSVDPIPELEDWMTAAGGK